LLPPAAPNAGGSGVNSGGSGVNVGGSGVNIGFPAVSSARQLLDYLAPKLTRDEELYALSLVDLVKGWLGEEVAELIAGDLSQVSNLI